jgi:diacylglycerol kinase (ATP)
MFSSGGEAHLILNPSAGKGRTGGLRASVSRFFEERGLRPVWHVTQGPGHAGGIVRGLPEEVSVVAVGGDGTVHEVAAACAGTGRTMGVLPAGSGNDYVKALGVGTGLRRALEVLVEGRVRVVDTAVVNGVPFNNGLGIGFDAEVAAGVTRAPAYLGGTGRYVWSVGRLLKDFRCHEARLVIDGESVEAKTIRLDIPARAWGGTGRRSIRCDLVRGGEPGRGSAAHTGGAAGHSLKASEGEYCPSAGGRDRTLRGSTCARRR